MFTRSTVLFIGGLWALVAFAAGGPSSYAEAEAAWKSSRDKPLHQAYAEEFIQFNNFHRLDEKDGCYALSPGPVNLYLVITHTRGEQFARVERVVSSVNNQKASCFKRTYEGLRTKAPPFAPFVMQLGMG